MFTPAADIWLDRVEAELEAELAKGEMPFLGLYGESFPDGHRTYLAKQLHGSSQPIQAFVRGLERWPAVFAAYLTAAVLEGYGSDSTHAVYPLLEEAICGPKPGCMQARRESLWRAFRRASGRLGLAVSPRTSGTNYMVDEYLHQSGVPLPYVRMLTTRMLQHAKSVGLPDDDDPAAIRLWAQTLREQRLRYNVSITVSHAIGSDDTGYYVRLFLRVLESPSRSAESGTAIEREMAEAILAVGQREAERVRANPLAIPRVVWREGLLGVELPAGTEQTWSVGVAGETTMFEGRADRRFVALEQELPSHVTVTGGAAGLKWNWDLWDDGRNNRFLLFDAQGMLVTGSRLGAEAPVNIPPGDFLMVSRFCPGEAKDEADQVASDPDLYAWPLSLEPGMSAEYRRGPASVSIIADSRPMVKFRGLSLRDAKRNEIWASTGLKLWLVVPAELTEGAPEGFTIRLTERNGGAVEEIFIPPDRHGEVEVALESYCSEWRPGITRVLAELFRTGGRRPLARAAIVLWNGLKRIDDQVRFLCNRWPSNLVSDRSDNLRERPEQNTLSFREDSKRYFTMEFETGERGTYRLTWSVPGIYLNLREYGAEGLRERPLTKGSVISVAANSRAVFQVLSTVSGSLALGEYRQRMEGRGSAKLLHLSGLVGYLSPESSTLLFLQDGLQEPIPLARLVTPHQVFEFQVVRSASQQVVRFALAGECEELRLCATELVSGRQIKETLHCNAPNALLDASQPGWLSCAPSGSDGKWMHELTLYLDRWVSGVWVQHLEAKLGGRWGNLTNSRGDVFDTGVLVDIGSRLGAANADILALFQKAAQEGDALATFRRLNVALQPCYAPESWAQLAWLAEAWKAVGRQFEPQDGPLMAELIHLAATRLPETGGGSWVPMYSVLALHPWLVTRPASSYRRVNRQRGTLPRTFSFVSTVGTDLSTAIGDGLFDPAFLAGFGNFADMVNRNAAPKGFDAVRYRAALGSRDIALQTRIFDDETWYPGEGDLLGPLHYRFAVQQMQETYRASLDGNALRRSTAFFLSRAYRPDILPKAVCVTEMNLNQGWWLNGLNDDSDEETELMLRQLATLISLLAGAARWDAREAGMLDSFLAHLRETCDERLRGTHPDAFHQVLSYLLFIGEDLFAFYLLFWEAVFAAR